MSDAARPGCLAGNVLLPHGGALDPGESARAAAVREFAEEATYRVVPEALTPPALERVTGIGGRVHEHNSFLPPYDNVQLIRCFEGQEMRWATRGEAVGLRLRPGQTAISAALGAVS